MRAFCGGIRRFYTISRDGEFVPRVFCVFSHAEEEKMTTEKYFLRVMHVIYETVCVDHTCQISCAKTK